jgi:hypothetical protein
VQAWFIVGGIGCVAMGIIAALTPAIRHLEDGRQRMEADAKAGSKRILTPRS